MCPSSFIYNSKKLYLKIGNQKKIDKKWEYETRLVLPELHEHIYYVNLHCYNFLSSQPLQLLKHVIVVLRLNKLKLIKFSYFFYVKKPVTLPKD